MSSYTTVFDAATLPYPDWPFAVIPAGCLVIGVWLRVFRPQKKVRLLWLAAVLTFLVMVAMPYYDYRRVQGVLRAGESISTVEGPISQHWTKRVQEARRSGESPRFKVYEHFVVDGVWFGYYRGISGSAVAFTNSHAPRVRFRDGLPARVSYYVDPFFQDERRIVRLGVGEMFAKEVIERD